MHNIVMILFGIILLSFQAEASVRIKKVNAANKYILQASQSGELQTGMTFSPDGNEFCEIRVTKTKGTLAAATGESCSDGGVAEGTKLNPTSGTSDSESSRKSSSSGEMFSAPKPGFMFGGSLYYSMASTIEESSKTASTTILTSYTTTGALGLGAKAEYVSKQSWSLIGGFDYEFSRKISSATQSALGFSQTTTYADLNLALMVLHFSGAYYFYKGVYGFGGFNYSIPELYGANKPANRSDAGALGLQIGAGSRITDMFGAELAYRTINASSTSPTVTYDYTRLWGFMIRGYVLFGM